MNTDFHGIWRMDWGFGNPNKTAALIAMLMILAWSLACMRKWGFWISLGYFISLGFCLMHTASRGGLIAVCAGAVWLLWRTPRPWNVQRTIAIAVGVGLIVLSSVTFHTYARYGQGLDGEDRSITNRLVVWEAAPRMMIDAPYGWGVGNSGNAYLQWYQPIGHHEIYRTLVNSHLTWLVEFGWPLRFAYLAAWSSVLLLCWPTQPGLVRDIPLAIWIAFGVSAIFSSIAESICLWVVPSASLAVALWWRWRAADWPNLRLWSMAFAIAGFLLLVLFILGLSSRSRQIHGSPNQVVLGTGIPRVWVVIDSHVLGSDFGRTLREHTPSFSVGLITKAQIPRTLQGALLVICGAPRSQELGKWASIAPHFQRVLLVNPTLYPQEFNVVGLHIDILYGEFSSSPSISEWRSNLAVHAAMMRGIGDFVPDWPLRLLDDSLYSNAPVDHKPMSAVQRPQAGEASYP